jgi:hypothetical protein
MSTSYLKYIVEPRKRLTTILILTAMHSFFVGLGLIVQLPEIMGLFGFGHIEQPFFPAQGGVFHILMSAAYFVAAKKPEGKETLIYFIIGVKMTAALFLFLYFILIQSILMIILSGIIDGVFALLILTGYKSFKNSIKKIRG